MILITGATGNVGSQVVQHLQEENVRVRALVHSPEKAGTIVGPKTETVQADLNDPSSLDEAFDGVDTAFIVVPPSTDTWALKKPYYEAAKRAGVGHIVNLSAFGAATDGNCVIARSHGNADEHIANGDLPWTTLRPHFFYQNVLGQADNIVAGRLELPFQDGKVGAIDVRDVGAVAARILIDGGHEGHAVDLTGPRSIGMADAAKALGDAIGRPVEYVAIDRAAGNKMFRSWGLPPELAEAFTELMHDDFGAGHGDTTTNVVENVLGREPISIEAFAKDHKQVWNAALERAHAG